MTAARAVPVRRVFVGGLDAVTTADELRSAFGDIGVPLAEIEVVMWAATGCSRCFAFVVIPHAETAPDEELLRQMRTAVVRGRSVTVHPVPDGLHRRQTS